jgi:XTP/dITP diphosphohydrolase
VNSCSDFADEKNLRQARLSANFRYLARMTTLLIATRNVHKVGEIRAILGPSFQFLTLNDFPAAPPVIEDADTFAGNAAKKAMELARWLAAKPAAAGNPPPPPNFVLADDSGLEVDALHGAPGVYSARFAALDKKENSSDADNNAKLLRLLAEVPAEKRTARFRCVIALVAIQGPTAKVKRPQLFDGACEGKIILEPRGRNGFGYDPLFVPDGHAQTFAELGDEVKNQLSHRARALAKLKIYFTTK